MGCTNPQGEHKVGKDQASLVGNTLDAHIHKCWDSWESGGPRVMLQSSLTWLRIQEVIHCGLGSND